MAGLRIELSFELTVAAKVIAFIAKCIRSSVQCAVIPLVSLVNVFVSSIRERVNVNGASRNTMLINSCCRSLMRQWHGHSSLILDST